jgi:hypothetical protein
LFAGKKKTVEKFFENRACQRLRTPYNAPPLTRNNGKQAAGSAGFRFKKLFNRLFFAQNAIKAVVFPAFQSHNAVKRVKAVQYPG